MKLARVRNMDFNAFSKANSGGLGYKSLWSMDRHLLYSIQKVTRVIKIKKLNSSQKSTEGHLTFFWLEVLLLSRSFKIYKFLVENPYEGLFHHQQQLSQLGVLHYGSQEHTQFSGNSKDYQFFQGLVWAGCRSNRRSHSIECRIIFPKIYFQSFISLCTVWQKLLNIFHVSQFIMYTLYVGVGSNPTPDNTFFFIFSNPVRHI